MVILEDNLQIITFTSTQFNIFSISHCMSKVLSVLRHFKEIQADKNCNVYRPSRAVGPCQPKPSKTEMTVLLDEPSTI